VDTEAESDSRTVTIAPGLTVQLLEESEEGVNSSITVTRQSSALASALSSFATAYNGVVDELDKHRGDSGGALSGREIVYSLGAALRTMGRYAGAGKVSSLEQLGLSFDQTGQLKFDQFTLMAADFADSASVNAFLMGATGTGGFVKSASNMLDSIERPVSGSLKAEITSVKGAITRTDNLITTNQDRVNDLKASLQTQMAAADAAIAQMEQQYSFLSSMLESMSTSSYKQS
jgi:flagellar hook-associated protein 2